MPPLLFADSNVLIEALLIPQSAAYVVAEMVARGVFDLATCQICVTDTEDAIVGKLGQHKPLSLFARKTSEFCRRRLQDSQCSRGV